MAAIETGMLVGATKYIIKNRGLPDRDNYDERLEFIYEVVRGGTWGLGIFSASVVVAAIGVAVGVIALPAIANGIVFGVGVADILKEAVDLVRLIYDEFKKVIEPAFNEFVLENYDLGAIGILSKIPDPQDGIIFLFAEI